MNTPVLELKHVRKAFPKPELQELLVLDNVDFQLNQGEIVALLGKSGSGKSTLLRIMAGLLKPTAGEVTFKGVPVHGPIQGVTVLFQHVALMPWLTVLENVELGLEAQGVKRDERRHRALKAIDMIGLDGFESAFPRELSGGMKSRVGFARSLVVQPDILLIDELFSTLDILTAENLRSDLLDLWQASQTPLKSILMVTHDINEAALMADRIVVFTSDPGCVRGEIRVDLPHPRNSDDPNIKKIVDDIYTLMTSDPKVTRRQTTAAYKHKTIDIGYRLPEVEVSSLTGLIEEIVYSEHKGVFPLQDLAEQLHLDVDELFPMIDLLDILCFARVFDGDIELTPAGVAFGQADILKKKEIFAQHLQHIPLAKTIRQILDETDSHTIPEEQCLALMEEHLTDDAAHRVLMTVIEWGRYAEIFAYNASSRMLSLENPD
ncbi:MAG: nitrate/sulfonate/bicarbonate ABC transporter ATP-binding protein [Gammaproteobacteria bacterium]